VVDTGVGNDRCRPQNPAFHRLRTDFLEALDIAGIDRNGVDVVVNTHLHLDHVGWNTRWHNGTWTPTFPNARYMVPAEDFRYFHPDNAATMRPARTPDEQARFTGMRLVFEDSVQPIADAGQLTMWSSDHQISPSLLLRAAAGHTPGSSVLWLNTIAAVFVGDLMHSPLQILRPDDACAFDLDAATAAVARRRVLSEAAQRRALVIPAHYPGRGGARVDADGEAFAPQDWLNLAAL
jgi:glyoxylase-like metal-dependent hydrolase (beta-lactamase superfamily II)